MLNYYFCHNSAFDFAKIIVLLNVCKGVFLPDVRNIKCYQNPDL